MRCTWMMNVKQDRPGDNSWRKQVVVIESIIVKFVSISSMSSQDGEDGEDCEDCEDGEDGEDGEDDEDGGLSIMELSRIVALVR